MTNLFKKAGGILGINSRNLDYIAKHNSMSQKKLADDKIFTKHFLESRGIGVAKLYNVVHKYTQLTPEFFHSLPDVFVIKPNRGMAGGGIIVIVRKKGKYWYTIQDKKIDEEFLYRHCMAILDGKYSISGAYDKVIFEERLEPHPDFRKLTEVGLPDVRVIVFNMVPVLAMVRIPTYESEGKANMELGAIALGVDIGTGKSIGGAQHDKFVTKLPNGHSAIGFKVPFWDEILLAASKIQQATEVGFLGVDLGISKTGVKVLEINARSGLKVQIANRIPLKTRLEKVADLKVLTPEDGVEIAKTLFSQTSKSNKGADNNGSSKPVVGITELVVLNSEKPQTIKARIDLAAETNIIKDDFYTGSIVDVSIQGKRVKLPVEKGKTGEMDLVLAGRFLIDFLIDPNKKSVQEKPNIASSRLDERMMCNIDAKLCEIDEKIKLLSYINPRNLAEQKALFLSNPEFSPRFFYKECDLNLEQMQRDLKRMPEVDHELFSLFTGKIKELDSKISLIQSVGTGDFQKFSERIFGNVGQQTYRSALNFLKQEIPKLEADESEELDSKASIEVLLNFLKLHKLSFWKIKVIEETVADIQVTKHNTILLKKGAKFTLNRLKALLVHEIGTHVFRFENGKLQSFRIFERGTAGYLRTEEGLAIWNQNQLGLKLGEKFLKPAYQVVAIHLAEQMSFCDLFHYLQNTYDLEDEFVWQMCVRAKRGLLDTTQKGAFTKDEIYFLGNQDIEKFIADKGKISDLYVGKITIKDLKLVKKIENLKPAKFLL